MKLLALTKYGPMAASTRQRFIQYEPALAEAGIGVSYSPLLNDAHVQRLAEGKRASPISIATAYARRLKDLLRARQFDALWVHCELFPYLPGGFERLAYLYGTPIVFDYDDAIFHMYDESGRAVVRRLLGGKLEPLLRRATACCCGNEYLENYAGQFCENTIILPTVVDTDRYVPAATRSDRPVTIGWIGSSSTYVLIPPMLPLLRNLAEELGVRIRIVGAGKAAERDQFAGLDLIEWSEVSEIAEVQAMDIGIMPLQDVPFQRGKCGYKLIQYMACGLPVVASPVGVNATIVEEGVTGYLATNPDQWRAALIRLIDDANLRRTMGEAGRRRAVEAYSLQAHAPRLVEVMRAAVAPTGRTAP